MNDSRIFPNCGVATATRHAATCCLAAGLVVFIGVCGDPVLGQPQPPANDTPGAEVLTRGPVHEAFAGMVTFNPEPGLVTTKAPPEIIEELPPEERPEGDNVTWIPGYWAWDEERSDYLWVSGTWRALPPGRAWMAGYWAKTPQGYQWTSGYWADASAQLTSYLPPPPATVETGPNIAPPSPDYSWTPGCWMWYSGRYAWGPGYWALGRADWDWCPAHYVWTPRGYLFVGGFWDYPVERRGILFAPVYFESRVYAQRGYYYSPTIVISLGVFTDHLFLRPRYQHYYFGDYYAASYSQGGYYASFTFQSGRHGYDPIYSHQRWEHRQDSEWEHRAEASYQYRRDHEAARPPRTWATQKNINPGAAESKQNRPIVATTMDQLAKGKDSPLRFQPVAKEERQGLAQRGQEVQKSREQRRTLEATAVAATPRKPRAVTRPAQVAIPRSPIVAKPVDQLSRNQAPPQAQPTPKPELKRPLKSEPRELQPNAVPSNPQSQSQPQPRQSAPGKKSAPGRNESPVLDRPGQPGPDRRPAQSQNLTPVESRPAEKGLEKLGRPEAEPRAKASVTTTGAAQRDAQGQSERVQPVFAPATQRKRAAGEKGATKLLDNNHPRPGTGQPGPPDYPPAIPPTAPRR